VTASSYALSSAAICHTGAWCAKTPGKATFFHDSEHRRGRVGERAELAPQEREDDVLRADEEARQSVAPRIAKAKGHGGR
jgi:hypothetical protein